MTGRRLDRGDWIDRSEIIEIVQRQPKLQNVPGAEWNYNNTAYGLAAAIVERTSGQDFHVFMQENVFGPLGMTGTMVRPSHPPHRAEQLGGIHAHTRRIPSDRGPGRGGRGRRDVQHDRGPADLDRELRQSARGHAREPRRNDDIVRPQTTARRTGYGYGLFIDEQGGLKRVQHGGADVAHRSMLVYYPEINAGITTQSNHAQFNSNVTFELAEAFFKDAMEVEEEEETEAIAEAEFDPAAYDPEDFEELVGRYALDASPTFILTFTREDGTFYAQATGQQRLEIAPTSDSTFRLLAVEASVTFTRGEGGEVEGAILHQNGQNQPATRLEGEAPEEWAPTEDDLADYAGRFYSEELETFYSLAVEEGELVMRQRRLGEVTLEPGEEENFTGGNLTFAFERDRNGVVIGFYLSNVRTRDVRFGRVG